MSVEMFQSRIRQSQLPHNDRQWMPKWIGEYASFIAAGSHCELELTVDQVLAFLRSLRDRRTHAWQRLQAARALEWYQSLVLHRNVVDFAPFKSKLTQVAAREQRNESSEGAIPGEGDAGTIDPEEPKPVRAMRAKMRLLHHPRSTEDAYVGWLKRFIRHVDDEGLEKPCASKVKPVFTGGAEQTGGRRFITAPTWCTRNHVQADVWKWDSA
jgi:hypothetical protein